MKLEDVYEQMPKPLNLSASNLEMARKIAAYAKARKDGK